MPDELEVFLKEHRRRQNPYNDFIEDSAERHNVDPDMVRAMMHQESSNKKGAVSHKGASGLMQLMPATAQRLGVKNIFDPKENIEGGTKYARRLLDMFGGNVELALAGYNAGEGAVQKYGNKVPPYRETQDYVKRIRGNYQGKGYKRDPLEQFIQKSRPAIDTSTLKPTTSLEDFVEDFRKQNPITSPTFPTAQPLASPPPAGALTDAGYQSRPVQQAVTETDDTIQSQINSALDDKVKTRYGVLTTSTEQNGQLFNAGFKAFPVGNEMLWLNVPKILKNKKLGIKDEKHLRQYVEKNGEKALTQFIGIAKPVDDTSNGVAVTAETNGVENASAVVTDEKSAAKQVKNYNDQFPNAVKRVTTTDEIAAGRIGEHTREVEEVTPTQKRFNEWRVANNKPNDQTAVDEFNTLLKTESEQQQAEQVKTILAKNPAFAKFLTDKNLTYGQEAIDAYNASLPKNRGGGVKKQRVIPRRNGLPDTQPASTKYDEKEYQVYLESMRLTGRSPLSFADFVRTHPAKQAQSFTNIEGENEDGQEQRAPTGQGINDNTDLGTVTVNPKWSDEEKVRYALSKILPNYDVTPQEIEDWIAQAKGRLSDDPKALVLHPGDKTISDFTVRGRTLKQIKGEFKPSTPEEIVAREKKEAGMALTDDELRAKAKANIWDNPLSGGTDADIQAEYERLKRTELSSDEKASAVSVGDFIKTIMDAPMGGAFGSGGKEGQKIASGTISGLIESVGGRGSEFVSGLYRYSLPGLIQRGIGQVTGQEDFTADKITKFANQAKVVGVSAKGDGILYDVGNVGGNLAGDVPRLVGLTVLSGGNPVIAFGVDEFLRSAGRGETIGEQAKYAIKGAVLGAIFHGASRLGASVEEGLTTALLPKQSVLGLEKGYRPNVDIALVTKLAGESVRVGTIGTGTFATSKLEGASTKEALYNTALMLLTDLGFNHKKYGQMADMSGKVFRLWKNGEYKDFLVWLKESGAKTEVYDVTGKVSDNNIQAVLSDEMPAGIKNVTPRKPKGSLEGTVEYPQPKEALWKNAENDQPVKVVGEAGKLNGEIYYNIEGSKTAVPASEITFTTPATTITDAEPVYKGKDVAKAELPLVSPEENAAKVEEAKRQASTVTINGSGESSASQESINRAVSEKAQQITRVAVDTRSGNERPLIGADAVDYQPQPFESVEFRGGDRNGEVIAQGDRVSPAYAAPSRIEPVKEASLAETGKDTQPASETQDESETKRAWRLESAQETSALKELGYSEEQIAALNQNDKADIIHQREKPRPTVTESPLDRIERRLAENAKRGRLNLHREVHGAAKYNSDKVEVTVGQSFGRDRFSVNLSLPDSTSNTGFRQNPDAHKSFATVGEAYDYANELINRHDPAAEAEKAGEAQADVADNLPAAAAKQQAEPTPLAMKGEAAPVRGVTTGVRRKAASKKARKKKNADISFSRPDTKESPRLTYAPPYTTTALTKLSNFQGRDVKVDTIRQILKQGTTKAIEKDIIESVLNRPEFADNRTVPFDAIRSAVAAEIIPLRTIPTQSYANYGASSVGVDADEYVTHLYNTGLEHGRTGHFPSEFAKTTTWEMKAVKDPETGNTYYVATEEGVPLTEENLMQHVGTVSEDAGRVQEWITNRQSGEAVSGQNKGLFGHDRIGRKGTQSYVHEIQSDVFQKQKTAALLLDSYKTQLEQKTLSLRDPLYPTVNKIVDIEKRINGVNSDVARAYNAPKDWHETLQTNLSWNQSELTRLQSILDSEMTGNGADEYRKGINGDISRTKETINEIKSSMSDRQRIVDSPAYKKYAENIAELGKLRKDFEKNLSLTDKQFVAHRKNYTLRLIREAMRREALMGQEEFLIPSPKTLAKIEGYIRGETAPTTVDNGQYRVLEADDENELQQGDEIEVGDTDYTVVEVDGEEIIVADRVNTYTYSDYVEQEQQNEYDNAMDELKSLNGDLMTGEDIIETAQESAYVYFSDSDITNNLEEVDLDDPDTEAETRAAIRKTVENEVADTLSGREITSQGVVTGYAVEYEGQEFRGLTREGALKQAADYAVDRQTEDVTYYTFDADALSDAVYESVADSGRDYSDGLAEYMNDFPYAWEVGDGDWKYVPSDANIIRFLQPYAIAEQAENRALEAENEPVETVEESKSEIQPITQTLSDTQRTIVDKYEELMNWFRGERGDVEIVQDAKGNQWLSTKLSDKDKGDIVAFEREQRLYRKQSDAAMAYLAKTKNVPINQLAMRHRTHIEGGVLRLNPQAHRLFSEAADRGTGKDNGDWFGGYLNPDQVEMVREGLAEIESELEGIAQKGLANFTSKLDKAVDPEYGDLMVFADLPMAPLVVTHGLQEEVSHRADFRVRDSQDLDLKSFQNIKGYKKAVATVKQTYKTASKRTLHNEVIAKLFRDDADKVLGITEQERFEIEAAYRQQLLDAGISPKDIAFVFVNVTQSSTRFANETYALPRTTTRTRQDDAPRTKEASRPDDEDSGRVRGKGRKPGINDDEGREGRTPQVQQESVRRQSDEVTPPTKPPSELSTPHERGQQRTAKNLDWQSVERGLNDKYSKTAGYDIQNFKEQREAIANIVVNDPDRMLRIIDGKEKLPKDLNSGLFVDAVQLRAMHMDAQAGAKLLNRLTASDVAFEEISRGAQAMRGVQEVYKEEGSPLAALKELKKRRQAQAKDKGVTDDDVRTSSKRVKELERQVGDLQKQIDEDYEKRLNQQIEKDREKAKRKKLSTEDYINLLEDGALARIEQNRTVSFGSPSDIAPMLTDRAIVGAAEIARGVKKDEFADVMRGKFKDEVGDVEDLWKESEKFYNEQIKPYGDPIVKTVEQRQTEKEKRLEKKLEDLKNQVVKKPRQTVTDNQAILNLQRQIGIEQQRMAASRGIEQRQKAKERQRQQIQAKIDAKDFAKPTRATWNLGKEGERLQRELDAAKQDLAALGHASTDEEVVKIIELSQNIKDARMAVDKTDDWTATNKDALVKYYTARRELETYIEKLTPNSALEVAINISAPGSILMSARTVVNNPKYQAFTGASRLLTKRIVSPFVVGASEASKTEQIKNTVKALWSSPWSRQMTNDLLMGMTVYHKTGYDTARDFGFHGSVFFGEHISHAEGQSFKESKGIGGKGMAVLRGHARFMTYGMKYAAGEIDVFHALFQKIDTTNLLARKVALDEQSTGKLKGSVDDRVAEIYNDAMHPEPKTVIGKKIREAAVADANRANVSQREKLSDLAVAARDKLKIKGANPARLWIQFLRLPINAAQLGVEIAAAPAKLLHSAYEIRKALKETDDVKRTNAVNQAIQKGLTIGGLYLLAYGISSALDDDDYIGAYNWQKGSENELAETKNAGANMIRVNIPGVGQKWVSTSWLGPLGIAVSAFMEGRQAQTKGSSYMAGYMMGMLNGVLSFPGVKEVWELGKTVERTAGELGDKNADDNVESIAKMWKLNPGDVAKWLAVRTLTSTATYDVFPLISDKPKYGALGDKVPQRGDSVGNAIAGFFIGSSVKSDTSNAITQEFDRLMFKGELPTVEDYKSKFATAAKQLLGEDAYEQKMNEFKRKYAEGVTTLMKSPEYHMWSDAKKKEEIDKIRQKEIVKQVQMLAPDEAAPKPKPKNITKPTSTVRRVNRANPMQ